MKKLLIAAILSLSLFSSQAQDDDQKTITGSGNVISRDVSVNSFTELDLSGVYSVVLSQGDKESVKIEADDNLQSLFEVKNEGNTLVVAMKRNVNIRKSSKMKVHITFKKLKNLEVNMVGNVKSESTLNFEDLKIDNGSVGSVSLDVNAQTIKINNRAVGNITLSGKASEAWITNSGVGSIQAGSFTVQKMEIENTGVGNAEVNAEKELKVKDSFLGKVKNKGAAIAKKQNKQTI